MLGKILRVVISQTKAGPILGRIPFAETAFRKFVWRHPKRWGEYTFSGVYASREEALADAPSEKKEWDVDSTVSSEWLLQPSIYSSFFWLSKVVQPGSTVVDLGGSVGNTFYTLQERSTIPDRVKWLIVEVPPVVERGKKIAIERNANELAFTADLKSVTEGNVLFTAGCLQYLTPSVPGLLESMSFKPRHIIINKLPLTSGASFWSLQDIPPSVIPVQVFNETSFFKYFEDAGYVVRDRWSVAELMQDIPFRPDCRLPSFSGAYMELTV